MTATFLVGDTRKVVEGLPDGSIDLVMTSPPFLALRSYLPADHPNKALEIGSEPTPAAFLDTLLELTDQWGRKLAPHGSIVVELGDTFAGSGGAGGDYLNAGLREGQPKFSGSASRKAGDFPDRDAPPRPPRRGRAQERPGYGGAAERWDFAKPGTSSPAASGTGWPLDKSLCLISTLYPACLAYGRNLLNPDHTFEPWRVRNLIVWARSNPPVGALGDKFRPATSYLTVACRSPKRWFDLDAVRTPLTEPGAVKHKRKNHHEANPRTGWTTDADDIKQNPAGAPPLDWWQISPEGYPGAHFATFPEALCVRPIQSMCPRRVCRTCGEPSRRIAEVSYEPDERGGTSGARRDLAEPDGRTNGTGMVGKPVMERVASTTGWTTCGCPGADGIRLDGFHSGAGWRPGIVLDPFGGTGTVGAVAVGHGRDAILVDLDERNVELARGRLGMFMQEGVA
jgi:DNA modification methylase